MITLNSATASTAVHRHADAPRAADNHVLYRGRFVAWRSGAACWPPWRPKPVPDQAGNGTHLHASLTDLLPDGAPAAQRVRRRRLRNGLSQVGYDFIGGLLADLPALVALSCASVNSDRRLHRRCGPACTCDGMDNREAAIRKICSPLRGDPAVRSTWS